MLCFRVQVQLGLNMMATWGSALNLTIFVCTNRHTMNGTRVVVKMDGLNVELGVTGDHQLEEEPSLIPEGCAKQSLAFKDLEESLSRSDKQRSSFVKDSF